MLHDDSFNDIRAGPDNHINDADSGSAHLPASVIISIVILIIVTGTPTSIIVIITPAFTIILVHFLLFLVKVSVVWIVLSQLEGAGDELIDVGCDLIGALSNYSLKRGKSTLRKFIILVDTFFRVETPSKVD